MLLKVIAITSLMCLVNGQELFPKNCSSYNVTTVKNYTLSAYLGRWFEIKRYNAAFEKGGDCVRADYKLKNKTHVQVLNLQKNLQSNVTSSIEGIATEANSTLSDGKLIVTFGNRSSDYWVVNTDYKSFAIVWSCKDISASNSSQFLWLLSRDKNFSTEALQTINKTIEQYGFEPNKLRATNQNPTLCNGSGIVHLSYIVFYSLVFILGIKFI